jgi:hypothetical protein
LCVFSNAASSWDAIENLLRHNNLQISALNNYRIRSLQLPRHPECGHREACVSKNIIHFKVSVSMCTAFGLAEIWIYKMCLPLLPNDAWP